MVTLQHRLAYTLITLGVIVLVALGINALTPGVKPNPGHWINETAPPSPCANGEFLQFDGTNWRCSTPSGSGGWMKSGTNVFLSAIGDAVGIGTNSPQAKLDVVGNILLSGSNRILSFGNFGVGGGIISWVNSPGVLALGPAAGPYLSLTSNGAGLNTTNLVAGATLDVNGGVHAQTAAFDTSVATQTLYAQSASINSLSVGNVEFEDLVINQTSFTMKATNGDNCVVQVVSSRSSANPAPGSFTITCYAPGDCGDYVVDEATEECDPAGATAISYDVTGPEGEWDCNPYLVGEFDRVYVGCDTGANECQFVTSVDESTACKCTTRCFNSVDHSFYSIYYTCSAYASTSAACAANSGPV